MTMPLFTAQAPLEVLGFVFGLLGWTTGFLVDFGCFVADIGVVVFKRTFIHIWASSFISYAFVLNMRQ